MKTNAKAAVITLCTALACLCALGCSPAVEQETEVIEAEVTVTAEPMIVNIEVVEQEVAAALQAPIPTPTAAPTPTSVPFSQYAPTVNMTYEELVGSTDDMGESGKELLKEGFPDPKTYYIIVDKQWQITMVYKRIDDGTRWGKPDYDQPVRYMLCSSGNPDREYGHDTTSGIWAIEIPKERFYQFVNLEAAQYLTLIHSRTYFHSILYDKKGDLSTLLQSSYDELGKKASHACIRLTVPDSRWMWYNIGYGTTCEIRDGRADDTETAAIRAQLVLPASKSGVRLRASEYVWTDNWSIDDVAHDLEYKYQKAPLPDLGDGADEDMTPAPGGTAGGGTTGGATVVVTPNPTVTQAPAQATKAPATATEAPRNDDISGADVTF